MSTVSSCHCSCHTFKEGRCGVVACCEHSGKPMFKGERVVDWPTREQIIEQTHERVGRQGRMYPGDSDGSRCDCGCHDGDDGGTCGVGGTCCARARVLDPDRGTRGRIG